jgi:hypothetical protein
MGGRTRRQRASVKRCAQNQRPMVAATVEGKRRRWGGWSMGLGGCIRSKGGASR